MTDYGPEAVEAILSAFNDRVLQAIQDEDRVDEIILHDHLREAIAKTMEFPDSPWVEVTVRGTSPTPVEMMVFDTTSMPHSKAKAKALGKGPRAVIWPVGHPDATQASEKCQGPGKDPEARQGLLTANWEAFAHRLLRKQARKHMFKTMLAERRRRAIIMRENVARRTLIHANPQLGLFRPIDIYEDSQAEDDDDDDDDEPTASVAAAASDAPTAAPSGCLPPLVIGRALHVLNAPGSTKGVSVPPFETKQLRSFRY